MVAGQARNGAMKSVDARMQWVCDDPRTMESHGLRLLDTHTLPAHLRNGLRVASMVVPVLKSYGFNLFEAHNLQNLGEVLRPHRETTFFPCRRTSLQHRVVGGSVASIRKVPNTAGSSGPCGIAREQTGVSDLYIRDGPDSVSACGGSHLRSHHLSEAHGRRAPPTTMAKLAAYGAGLDYGRAAFAT